jgi:YEATS domain-containing protein 4
MEGYKTCPILIGSESSYVPEGERPLPELTHEWKCYVKATPGLVKAVQFRLHESFKSPYINVGQSPFQIVERGWGEFTIQIKITLFNDEKVSTSHYLRLHGNSYPVVSEKVDTVAYRGGSIDISPEFMYSYENDDEEFARIDGAISYMLDLYEGQCKTKS